MTLGRTQKTQSYQRWTQNRGFPLLPPMCNMFTPLHSLLRTNLQPPFASAKAKNKIGTGFLRPPFASALRPRGRNLRPPTVSPCVHPEISDNAIPALAGPGGRKFWENLAQCIHEQPWCLDRSIVRRIHDPATFVILIALFFVPLL